MKNKLYLTYEEIDYILGEHKFNTLLAKYDDEKVMDEAASFINILQLNGLKLTHDELIRSLKNNVNNNISFLEHQLINDSNDYDLSFNDLMALPIVSDMNNALSNMKILKSVGVNQFYSRLEYLLNKPQYEIKALVLQAKIDKMTSDETIDLIDYEYELSNYAYDYTGTPAVDPDFLEIMGLAPSFAYIVENDANKNNTVQYSKRRRF